MNGKNVLIVSGGCIEKWDSVRGHTNLAKGTIGKMVAEECLNRGATVTYLHGYFSAIPNIKEQQLRLESFEGILDLQDTMEQLILTSRFDAVVMAAAGSDWIVDKMVNEKGEILSQTGKLSSDHPPIIHLKKAPKVINSIKKWDPKVLLIGFKLESAVGKVELIERAANRMEASSADYMVANTSDSLYTVEAPHYILNQNRDIAEYAGKEETAKAIVEIIEHAI